MIRRKLANRRSRPSARGPRVGLYGLLCFGNSGNDGSFDVVLDYLHRRHGDATLDCLCPAPAAVTSRYGLPATRMHWNRREYETADSVPAIARKAVGKVVDAFRIAAWVCRHDVVIMPGMGAFEATLPLRPWGTPYSQFVLSTAARMFGVKMALVSVGANDVSAAATRRLFVASARRVHYLSYRDAYSRDAMRRMGLEDRGDEVFPDLVFALPTPAVPAASTNIVGVGVLDYHGGNDDRARADELHTDYVESLQHFVCWLLDNGRDIRIFTGDRVDEVVVQEILGYLGKNRPDLDPARVQVPSASTLQSLMREMAVVDTVVATRYHNVLCALKLGKPTLSIGYASKNDELMAGMGLGDFCQRADAIDVERLVEQFEELDRRRVDLVQDMVLRNADYRSRLDDQFALLDAVLFEGFPASCSLSDQALQEPVVEGAR